MMPRLLWELVERLSAKSYGENVVMHWREHPTHNNQNAAKGLYWTDWASISSTMSPTPYAKSNFGGFESRRAAKQFFFLIGNNVPSTKVIYS